MNSVMIKALDGFASGVRKLNDAMQYVGIAAICVISVVALYNVGTRILNIPVSWPLEFLELVQVVLAYLPIAYVLNRNAHVRMDLMTELLHGRRKLMLRVISSLLGVCLSLLLCYATSQSALASVRMKEGSVLTSIPIYPFKIVVTVGFVLLALQFAGHAWESFRSLLFPSTDTGNDSSPVVHI